MIVAVIGAGIMGSGIAQVAATAGHTVAVREPAEGPIERAKAAVDKSLARFVKSGKLGQAEAEAVRRRITYSTELEPVVEEADVVIEAVPELLEIKGEVLSRAAEIAPGSAIFGTNTSELSITSIGAAMGDAADRLIGMHFFNPPVMMRLLELICGLRTSQATLAAATKFGAGLGKEIVVCRKDSPGFLTSRAYAILRLECVRMVEEGLAEPEDIDKAFRLGFNFPMGPLELGDFNGVDTFVHVLDALSEAYGDRFKPTPGLRNMIAAGHHGRKSGRGFYEYNAEGTNLTRGD